MKVQFTRNGETIAEREAIVAPEIVNVGGAWIDGVALYDDTPFTIGDVAADETMGSKFLMECFEFHVNDGESDEWEMTQEGDDLDAGATWGYRLIRGKGEERPSND